MEKEMPDEIVEALEGVFRQEIKEDDDLPRVLVFLSDAIADGSADPYIRSLKAVIKRTSTFKKVAQHLANETKTAEKDPPYKQFMHDVWDNYLKFSDEIPVVRATIGAVAGPVGVAAGGAIGGYIGGHLTAPIVQSLLGETFFNRPKKEALENAYAIPGVPKSATNAEVNSAFRRKALQCHPDKHPDKNEEWMKLQYAMATIRVARGEV